MTVKNGYARNFLIPNGSAILATSSAKKVLAENIKQQAVKDKKIIDDANKLAKKITELELKIKAKAGEGSKLFGSINNVNIQKELESNGVMVDKKIILLFGCGGNRDQNKRYKMGKIASNYSNEIYLTDDNPRFEDPQKIRNDIKKGTHDTLIKEIPNRKQAISEAVKVGTFLVADERSRCRHEPQTRGTPFVNHRLHHC